MFKLCLSILFAVLSLQCVGQNLVPNGSFEDTVACPTGQNQIYLSTNWFQPNNYNGNTTNSSSTEYFNECNSSDVSVPNNLVGNQFPNTGKAYAGIVCYGIIGPHYREYIEGSLNSPLVTGRTYCVQFYVSLSDHSNGGISSLGAYLSNDSILYNNIGFDELPYTPQVANSSTNVILDKTNWVLISGQFVASGGEQFITIGNFNNDPNSNYQPCPGSSAVVYYYVDDVSVTCCDPSGTCTLSLPESPEKPFSIPTLLSTNDVFYIKGADAPVNLTLYDARGRLTYKNEQYINDLSLVAYAEGIYFYVITLADGRTERGKLVIGK